MHCSTLATYRWPLGVAAAVPIAVLAVLRSVTVFARRTGVPLLVGVVFVGYGI